MNQIIKKLLFFVTMLSTAMTSPAYDFESGNFQYTILSTADLTCEIAGLTDSGKNLETIEIPETVNYLSKTLTVKAIGDNAFDGNETIKQVIFSNTITEIGYDSFYGCKSIKSLEIPDNISYIHSGAFTNCEIEEVYVSSLEKWLSISFYSNPLNNDKAKLYIDGKLLEGTFNTPEWIDRIPQRAFQGYSYLKEVYLNCDCDVFAFNNCKNIEKVTIGPKVNHISYGAFEECAKLHTLIIEDCTSELGLSKYTSPYESYAFSFNTISELYLGRKITNSYNGYNLDITSMCNNLKTITIGSLVSYFSFDAIAEDAHLSSMVFKDSEEHIELIISKIQYSSPNIDNLYVGRPLDFSSCNLALYNTSSLYWGEYAKGININLKSPNLSKITIMQQVPPHPTYYSKFSTSTFTTGTLTVPKGCKSVYENDSFWKQFWNIIEADEASGIEDINIDNNMDKPTIKITKWGISISGADDNRIDIYSVGGTKVYSGYDSTIPLASQGVYIVCIGSTTQKIVI